MKIKQYLLAIFFSTLFMQGSFAQQQGPNVLVVMAHPDDETTFAATLYKITKEQHGTVDLFTITNGEGGYKYSTLAEDYYGVTLTDEAIGRKNLPEIRKKELRNAGHILGVGNYYFLDQKDAHYTTDEHEPIDTSWNVALVQSRLAHVLKGKQYDYVFCLLPEETAHGQHKAATIIALQTIASLPKNNRPIVLGAVVRNKSSQDISFDKYHSYAETVTNQKAPDFFIDRTTSFSYNSRLNYKVVVNWEIAEHKSQGVMQMAMNDGDLEEFWYFGINGPEGLSKCRSFFDKLKEVPYLTRSYQPLVSTINHSGK